MSSLPWVSVPERPMEGRRSSGAVFSRLGTAAAFAVRRDPRSGRISDRLHSAKAGFAMRGDPRSGESPDRMSGRNSSP